MSLRARTQAKRHSHHDAGRHADQRHFAPCSTTRSSRRGCCAKRRSASAEGPEIGQKRPESSGAEPLEAFWVRSAMLNVPIAILGCGRRAEFFARNRIVVSPMCQYRVGERRSDRLAPCELWESTPIGGAGIVFTEETAVEERGRKTYGRAGIYSDEPRPCLSQDHGLHPQSGRNTGNSIGPCRPKGIQRSALERFSSR